MDVKYPIGMIPSAIPRSTRTSLALAAILISFSSHAQTAAPQATAPQATAPQTTTPKTDVNTGAITAGAASTANAAPSSTPNGPTITLPFFVFSKKEEPIASLTKDSVTIGEDGHPEVIQTVASAADQPISLGILVDTRSSLGGMVQTVRAPLQHFVDDLLTRPADQAAVIDFNDDAGLDIGLTRAHDKVKTALDHISAHPAGAYSTTEVDKNVGGNVLFDALFLASDDVLKTVPGRKVIVVVTDGLDRGSKENILSAIEAAQRAHALIYTIEFPAKEKDEPRTEKGQNPNEGGGNSGGGYPGGGGGYPGGGGFPGNGGGYPGGGRRRGERPPSPVRKDAKKVLMQLSTDSGGHYYEVSSKESIDQVLTRINEQLKSEYMLTYALNKDDREEGFHRVTWATKEKDQLLQAPGGFYIDRP